MSDELSGLSAAEVDERVADGRVNDVPDAPVRTIGQIVKANVITPVNGIIGTLLVLILVAGFPEDALFAGVIVANSLIGIGQEVKARRTLNALAVLSAPKARVRRDGVSAEIGTSGVVADDLLELVPGDQVVVDGTVVSELGLEIDESLLTGESDAVDKNPGDSVMSGSFVAAGSGFYRATAIGASSYAAKLSEEARIFKLADSELRRGVNIILRWLTFIIPPAALLLLLRLLDVEDSWQVALQGTVAAAVAMVPDGLVLLTSLSFITGVLALARRKVLAKELASVELLARVDTLCLDKTGTITTGEISLAGIEPVGETSEDEARAAIGALGSLGGIVTKGLSLEPMSGNPAPRICETRGGVLNSIGLQNIGIEAFLSDVLPGLERYPAQVIVNLFGTSIDEYCRLAERVEPVDQIAAIELNVSCPNVERGGIEFGHDPPLLEELTARVRDRTAKPLIVKLSPNVTSPVEVAEACRLGGADILSCINTVLGMAVDAQSRRPLLHTVKGGLSGPAIKPIALRIVFDVARNVPLPVIAIGGVESVEDVVEFLLAGATAVQVGTTLFREPSAPERLANELHDYLEAAGVGSVEALVGALDLTGTRLDPAGADQKI